MTVLLTTVLFCLQFGIYYFSYYSWLHTRPCTQDLNHHSSSTHQLPWSCSVQMLYLMLHNFLCFGPLGATYTCIKNE